MEIKDEFLLKLFVGIVAFTAPITPVMGGIVFLVIADFVTAIYASYKSGEAIMSAKMGRTVSKFFFYNLAIMSAFVCETLIIPEIPLMRVASGFIAMTELKSIFENFNRIYGIDLWGRVKHLFAKKEYREKDLQSLDGQAEAQQSEG